MMITTVNKTLWMQKGFTFIELLAVLALAAILAGTVAVSLKAPYQSARLENSIERIILMDRQLRDHARRFARTAEMQINISAGTLVGVEPDKHEMIIPTFSLSSGDQIDEVILSKQRIDSGSAVIDYSVRGQTPTYVIRFSIGSDKRQWLVFLGMTGQIIRTDDEKEIDSILRIMQSQRTDAG
jgi:prepilin-type N-terminal cleavage/methylation domain-containing protein